MFYPFESRINSLVAIRRERLLPEAGELLVRAGDQVSPEDIIGRARPHSRWHYVNVAETLRVAPAAIEPLLTKKVGESVEKGEIIAARKGGLFTRLCKAPASGVVSAIHAGHVLIEEPGKIVEVRALLRGRVANLLAGRGAIIETKGALIRGAWSAGPSTWGVLKVLGEKPNIPLQMDQIDIRCHGAILAAGWCKSVEVLRQADQMQARGVILGSLTPQAIAAARGFSIPIVVIEGFGEIPMNEQAFELLHSHSGNEISIICPSPSTGAAPEAPEIILPATLDGPAPQPVPPSYLQAGQLVRIIGYPQRGRVGRIRAILETPRRLDSGALCQGVEVEMGDGQAIFAPWMNVEPIG